ncbi:16S rRNA (guanine(966)-N(2))-methyltransferase RsmD [Aeromicrobium wangtongii]|uniref:16S rRNA (Guanine(966)-N(2))-methyltransferase RsmD n=1 Tax=Aeromicrobium wangtongii TaxID=2969247 RepID=A0ABY5MG82_9ACTN|nr:16S rRNA (guanine(966)-N(2))-methyltransferase RsmD [Aeromicrobium wangtongii]MCD9197382.1 16S rRNA (guanine(966)-N(2))-methyltransferase RsmD [Aeromicrobium wangtongii]MCL3818309.1 16S rRNA (guanine(966)-N(2))-methyltransferase RsmD [Aeromicrobium wangtongii]UUP14876.1 16S rRNA (guanine(966)-N(2))-methyltransferase RsmD [Aeromicrobium wangtongii]
MTRIIAGQYGGRRIQAPKGDGTRPTSDRVREALFSSLESELGGFDGVRVLDLFAGSGALGIEALSRGAEHAVFVEANTQAASVIKRNLSELGAPGVVERSKAERWVEDGDRDTFDLVFVDPPYALPTDAVAGLVAAVNESFGDADTLFVVERSTRDPFVWPEGVEGLRSKKYGETTLWYGRAAVRSLA